MNNKLNQEILNLARKIKNDARQIRGEDENKSVEDIRYLENAIQVNGKNKNVICMVFKKGEDALSYRYYIDNKLVAVVEDDVSVKGNIPNLVILNESTKELQIDNERLRQLIQNPQSFEAEELSALVELEKNEKLVEKLAEKLGVSKDEIKGVGLLNAEQKIKEKDKDKKQSELQNENEIEIDGEKVYEDDINVKQNMDANVMVDEMRTLGQVLKVSPNCKNIAVIETYQLDEINAKAKGNTRYAFAAINNDGTVELLEGLEEDRSVGINSTQETYKVEHDGNVEKNTVLSRYTIAGTDETLSVRNGEFGEIEVYHSSGKSKDGNESLDKQLQTDNVLWKTKREMRDVTGYYDKEGDAYKVDNAIDRAEAAYIEDNDDTEYKDLDNDEVTISDNELEISQNDEFEYEGKIVTFRRYATESLKYNNIEELWNMFIKMKGTPEERLRKIEEYVMGQLENPELPK